METPPPDIGFYIEWLKDLRKDLHPSGRASELALYLSKKEGASFNSWQTHIRNILDGTQKADANLLITIDQWRGGY